MPAESNQLFMTFLILFLINRMKHFKNRKKDKVVLQIKFGTAKNNEAGHHQTL